MATGIESTIAKFVDADVLAKIREALGGHFDYVPRARLNEVIEARDEAKHALDEAQAKAGKYDAAATKITELETKLTTQKADFDKQLAADRRSSKVELALVNAGAKNVKAVSALLDNEAIKDDLSGLEAEVKRVKTSDPYLFGSKAPFGTGKTGGDPEPSSLETLTKQLGEAQKAGNTALVLDLTDQIHELQRNQK